MRCYVHGIRLLDANGEVLFESVAYRSKQGEWHYSKLGKRHGLVGLHGYIYGESLCNIGVITARLDDCVHPSDTREEIE